MTKFHRFHIVQFQSKQISFNIQHRGKNKNMLLHQQTIKHEQVKRDSFINRCDFTEAKSYRE